MHLHIQFAIKLCTIVQVKDAVADRPAADPGLVPQMTSGREVLPALGLAWANCVNTRLFLSRQTAAVASPDNDSAYEGDEEGQTVIRRALQASSLVQSSLDSQRTALCG